MTDSTGNNMYIFGGYHESKYARLACEKWADCTSNDECLDHPLSLPQFPLLATSIQMLQRPVSLAFAIAHMEEIGVHGRSAHPTSISSR